MSTTISLPVVKHPTGLHPTRIQWADYTVNLLRAIVTRDIWVSQGNIVEEGTPDARLIQAGMTGWGCIKVSPGCTHCYAERWNIFRGTGLKFKAQHLKKGLVKIVLDEQRLKAALNWRVPKGFTGKAGDGRPKVFVDDMTDLFGDWVSFDDIDKHFALFALRPDIDWMVLTKRPERMAEYTAGIRGSSTADGNPLVRVASASGLAKDGKHNMPWPLRNVWLGISAEDQQRADERIPHLLRCPAAVRFLSCEPLLGDVSLRWLNAWPENWPTTAMKPHGPTNQFDGLRRIDWVIVGGESGPDARPCNINWIRSIVGQCKAAGVPAFVKQLGAEPFEAGECAHLTRGMGRGHAICDCGETIHGESIWGMRPKDSHGGDESEWPEDMRGCREWPKLEQVNP